MGITYLRVNFLECQLQPKLNNSKIAAFGHSTVRFNYLSVFVFYFFFSFWIYSDHSFTCLDDKDGRGQFCAEEGGSEAGVS